MPKLFRTIILMLALLPPAIFVARADPLDSTDAEPVLPDPKPNDSHAFSPSMANGGVADPSHALGAATASPHAGCSAANPCAMPTPQQTHVDVPRPAKAG